MKVATFGQNGEKRVGIGGHESDGCSCSRIKRSPKAKLGQVGLGLNIAQNHFSIHRKSYLVIICPNSHGKLTKSEFTSSWSWFEHCSESFV